MVQVKICGNQTPADMKCLNTAMPDYAGIILVPERRRTVTFTEAVSLRQVLNPVIPLVGVFQNQPLSDIMRYLTAGVCQIAQLHGDESETLVTAIQQAGFPVIQRLTQPTTQADIALYDDSHGGSGRCLDWQQLQRPSMTAAQQLMLAGGLTPSNVQAAVTIVQPDIVDVSSGVETDGRKDQHKITQFIQLTKGVSHVTT